MTDRTLAAHFEEQAERTPQSVALCYQEQRITYAALNARANQIAHSLRDDYGVTPELTVGLRARRSGWLVAGMLGILKAGAAYVPIDMTYPIDRQSFMLEDAQCAVLLTDDQDTTVGLDTVRSCSLVDTGRDHSKENPRRLATARNLAYVIYTSGSTSKPKGVMVEHGSILNTLSWRQSFYGFGPQHVTLQIPSVSFDSSVEDIFGMLLSGGSLVIMREERRRDLDYMAALLTRHRPTHILVVPSLYRILLAEIGAALSGLEAVTVAGEAVDLALVRQHEEVLPKTRLVNEYGPTENSVCTTACTLSSMDGNVTVGWPINNVHVQILDADLKPVLPGQVGQIAVSGHGLMRGYLRRPELTAERLVQLPNGEPDANTYLTGDRGLVDERGRIVFLGRLDGQVKIRGFRVEVDEIEAALYDHEHVRQAAVVARTGSNGAVVLIAYVQTTPSATEGTLRDALKKTLPEHMLPMQIIFLDELPRLPNGKIDRNALPAPAVSRESTPEKNPHTKLQSDLIAILSELLGVGPIALDDNFMQLGANSLILAQFAARTSRTLGLEVDTKDVFCHPTIAELSCVLSSAGSMQRRSQPMPLTPRPTRAPLTFQQEQVWFQHKLIPNNVAFNAQFSVHLKGQVNQTWLESSLSEIVRRHEILRTSFPEFDGYPVQMIHEPWQARIEAIDLRGTAAEVREMKLDSLVAQALRQPFDFSRLPLIRWYLFQLEEDDFVFLTVEFHFVHDGWSAGLFLRELEVCYQAFSEGKPVPLPEVPLQLSDYAIWQRDPAREADMAMSLERFERQLSGHSFAISMLHDRSRPAQHTLRGGLIRQDIPIELYKELRIYSRERQVTLFTTLLAVFSNLVARHAAEKDLIIGTAVANRQGAEMEGMLGMVVNIIPLRIDLEGDPSFEAHLNKTRDTLLQALQDQHVPIQLLVDRLKPRRVPGMNPLFQVQFSFHDSPIPDLDFAGLTGELTVLSNGTTKADLDVICLPRAEQRMGRQGHAQDDRLTLLWQYSTELFDHSTMSKLLERFLRMLDDAMRRPYASLSELKMMPNQELSFLSRVAFGPQTNDAENIPLQVYLEQRAINTPDLVAVRSGNRSLTYKELNARANRLAHLLSLEYGARPGSVVGLMSHRSEEAIVALLGILKTGAAFVPLDPAHPERRIRFMLQDADVSVIVATAESQGMQTDYGVQVYQLDTEALHKWPACDLGIRNTPRDIAYIIYTSGSTGTPKGVVVEHRGLLNLVRWYGDLIGIRQGDVLLAMSALSFDVAQVDIHTTLLRGGVLYYDEQIVGNHGAIADVVTKQKCTIISATPSVAYGLFEPGKMESLSGVRTFVFAGEEIHAERLRRWQRSPHCNATLVNAYGPTECTVLATAHILSGDELKFGSSIPIGRPVANARVYVLDEHDQVVPAGVPGEICIAGAGLSRGYLNQPELTDSRFVPDPFYPGERMYRSGDVGKRRSDGSIICLGRKDWQVKVRGLRIELSEVETAILAHPHVAQAVVLTHGQGDLAHLVAYTATYGQGLTSSELRVHLSEWLPGYMIPSHFVFVQSIPLTPTGKTDVVALRAVLPVEECVYLSPRTETERALADIWQQVLKRDAVGLEDHFFLIGGHSLLAMRVVSQVREVFGVELLLNSMFQYETLGALAKHVDLLQWSNTYRLDQLDILTDNQERGEI